MIANRPGGRKLLLDNISSIVTNLLSTVSCLDPEEENYELTQERYEPTFYLTGAVLGDIEELKRFSIVAGDQRYLHMNKDDTTKALLKGVENHEWELEDSKPRFDKCTIDRLAKIHLAPNRRVFDIVSVNWD